jgi:branched-chain amino acid transport system ATP-binding protein
MGIALVFKEAIMILEIKHILMEFGGLKAIDNLSFSIKQGEIFGLIGPNGAGKTTMFNIITCNYHPAKGIIRFAHEDIIGLKPHKIVQKGIARTFQNIRLFPSMNVLENVLIGYHNQIRYGFTESIFRLPRFRTEENRIRCEAMEILDYIGIGDHAHTLATSLSYGDQRKVEIARALATNPKLLLLDEPAAGMNPKETDELARIIQKVRKDYDLTIMLIEHDMPFINHLCERVLVLDYGRKLFEGTPQDAIAHEDVVAAYLGDVFHA